RELGQHGLGGQYALGPVHDRRRTGGLPGVADVVDLVAPLGQLAGDIPGQTGTGGAVEHLHRDLPGGSGTASGSGQVSSEDAAPKVLSSITPGSATGSRSSPRA